MVVVVRCGGGTLWWYVVVVAVVVVAVVVVMVCVWQWCSCDRPFKTTLSILIQLGENIHCCLAGRR